MGNCTTSSTAPDRPEEAAWPTEEIARDSVALGALHAFADDACLSLARLGGLHVCVMALVGAEGRLLPIGSAGDGAQVRGSASDAVRVSLRDGTIIRGQVIGNRKPGTDPPDEPHRGAFDAHVEAIGIGLFALVRSLVEQRARHEHEKVRLARRLHETVVQRLCGISMVMSSLPELDAESHERCSESIQLALEELRDALTPGEPAGALAAGGLRRDLEELRVTPGVRLSWRGGPVRLAPEREEAARALLAEAVRNARKHGSGNQIRVVVSTQRDRIVFDVSNQVRAAAFGDTTPGIGLRLAAEEARHCDLEYRTRRVRRRWHVQLAAPMLQEAG